MSDTSAEKPTLETYISGDDIKISLRGKKVILFISGLEVPERCEGDHFYEATVEIVLDERELLLDTVLWVSPETSSVVGTTIPRCFVIVLDGVDKRALSGSKVTLLRLGREMPDWAS